ncbi:hypothetical protein ACFOEM_13995 [Paenalcaligenes hominis]|uniref:hypothetical protein n=1 Tax=Paenalcaligenes hominis TaxID=643674 RepID=UPI00361B38F1
MIAKRGEVHLIGCAVASQFLADVAAFHHELLLIRRVKLVDFTNFCTAGTKITHK